MTSKHQQNSSSECWDDIESLCCVWSSYYAKNNHAMEIDTTYWLKISNEHIFF